MASARKLDSRKKANVPSIASVCPMTPPANEEKRAQLVPNWNSMGMPVTTPTAKLIPSTRSQKREAHGELREQIVKGDGEAELQAVPEEWIAHLRSSSHDGHGHLAVARPVE